MTSANGDAAPKPPESANVFTTFIRDLRKNFWIDPTVVIETSQSNSVNRQQVSLMIDKHGFDYKVWLVASSGFFTDSYNLFAANVILPSLGYIYWPTTTDERPELKINVSTLFGSLVGMLIFGFLADIYGRRKLYGLELIVVIFGTLGIVQASIGYDNSMDIMGWLIFWRFFMGIGIGAEYPLSAVITAEFAPKDSRASMMAAVFLMQSLGQLAAALVGLVVLIALGNQHGLVNLNPSDPASKRWVDSIWRTVIGAGAFPALVAIVFRLTIPESPRFTLDVDHDGQRALEDIREHYSGHIHGQSTQDLERLTEATREEAAREAASAAGPGHVPELINQQKSRPTATIRRNPNNNEEQEEEQEEEEQEDEDEEEEQEQEQEQEQEEEEEDEDEEEGEEEDEDEEEDATDDDQKAFSKADLYDYFIEQGSWRFLAGTSTCWFLLDFAFYGLGINSPRQIAHVWLDQPLTNSTLADWQSADSTVNIYHILRLDAIQYIYTVSIGSVVGSLLLIKFIDYVPRKALLIVSFLLLAALFFVVGGTLFVVEYTNQHALTIVLYALCQLFFNLGPNALTFIISAEIFPTRYRCTCHGISAAFGKLGSISVQLLLNRASIRQPAPVHLGVVLLIFGVFMGVGALFAWVWLPDVQDPRGDVDIATSLENGDRAIEGARQNGVVQRGAAGTESEAQRKKGSWLEKYKVPSKTLEVLAEGWKHTVEQGQELGFRRNLGLLGLLQPVVRMLQRNEEMQNGQFHQVVSNDIPQNREIEMEMVGGDSTREV